MKKIKAVFAHYELVCGGAEQALFDLTTLLDKEKFQVAVFVENPGGVWESKFRNAGIEVLYDYSCRKPTWNPVKKLENYRKKKAVQAALEDGGKGLLDTCCPDADIIVNYSAWKSRDIGFSSNAKSVKYIHGDPATNEVYRTEAMGDQERLARYDRIVCISRAAWASFRELSGLEHGVEMHYNPINSERVREMASEAVVLPDDLPLVCAVGRLSAEKGFERLILIHRHLLDQGVRYRLVIVGDGPDRDFLPRLIRAAGVEDMVLLAGYQENPYPYMKNSKFLVSSSYTEGLPVISMEALSLGIPIVAPIPSVGEAFGEEGCGLITENTMAGLEDGIRRMLTDGQFYNQCREAAQRRSAFFDGRRMVREIEDMFLELTGN